MSGELFVSTDTLSYYDGSYFELDDEVGNIKLVDFDLEGYKENKAIYLLKVLVNINGYSKEYWGKDDDTKQIIFSDGYIHDLEGEITVKLIRDADTYMEDLLTDTSFSKLEIISGSLKENDCYSAEDLCVECGKNIGQIIHRNGGMVCNDCAVVNDKGDICPMCGEKVPHNLMAAGFCKRCTDNSDYL